jgi:hypothetical protein
MSVGRVWETAFGCARRLTCINDQAVFADDNRRNRSQPKEKVVNAPSPDAAVPTASSPAAAEREPGRTAAVPDTGGRSPARIAKDIGLFFAAPYVTLASLAAFPFLGMKLLAQLRRERKRGA